MCEAEQKSVLHSIEDLALVTHITECELFPGVFEHADKLGRGRCQPVDLLRTLLTLQKKRTIEVRLNMNVYGGYKKEREDEIRRKGKHEYV